MRMAGGGAAGTGKSNLTTGTKKMTKEMTEFTLRESCSYPRSAHRRPETILFFFCGGAQRRSIQSIYPRRDRETNLAATNGGRTRDGLMGRGAAYLAEAEEATARTLTLALLRAPRPARGGVTPWGRSAILEAMAGGEPSAAVAVVRRRRRGAGGLGCEW